MTGLSFLDAMVKLLAIIYAVLAAVGVVLAFVVIIMFIIYCRRKK